jgi:hypothetical protein
MWHASWMSFDTIVTCLAWITQVSVFTKGNYIGLTCLLENTGFCTGSIDVFWRPEQFLVSDHLQRKQSEFWGLLVISNIMECHSTRPEFLNSFNKGHALTRSFYSFLIFLGTLPLIDLWAICTRPFYLSLFCWNSVN